MLQALCLFHGSERQWSLHVQVHSGRFVCLSAAEQARATTLPPETHASLTYLLIIPLILRDNLGRAIDRVYCHPQRLCLWRVTRSALVLWLVSWHIICISINCCEALTCPATGQQSPPHDRA